MFHKEFSKPRKNDFLFFGVLGSTFSATNRAYNKPATWESYKLFGNEREFINGRCSTIFGHFFANCINIFHKTEVQAVILMCLMGQNLNWFKSYNTKCTLRPWKILAKSQIDHQDLHLINGHFTTISGHFCANYMKIFHKTEVQMVILRCLTSTTVMAQNTKIIQKCKKYKCIFFYNITKKQKWKYLHFEA